MSHAAYDTIVYRCMHCHDAASVTDTGTDTGEFTVSACLTGRSTSLTSYDTPYCHLSFFKQAAICVGLCVPGRNSSLHWHMLQLLLGFPLPAQVECLLPVDQGGQVTLLEIWYHCCGNSKKVLGKSASVVLILFITQRDQGHLLPILCPC